LVSLSEPQRFERQMFEAWAPVLGLSSRENRRAIEQGFAALEPLRVDLAATGPRGD